jgi:hypothetical protein
MMQAGGGGALGRGSQTSDDLAALNDAAKVGRDDDSEVQSRTSFLYWHCGLLIGNRLVFPGNPGKWW